MSDQLQLWTEDDLLKLNGLAETLTLEFKSSALLAKERGEIVGDLSREISGLANTEGGTVVIGIKERREGKRRIADGLDEGADRDWIGPEQFQQIVQSSISPYLPGLRLFRVDLPVTRPGRCAYVIQVPKGSTAYQARDRKYYGRSEFNVEALPDHEIRLRMMRGRVASASLEIVGMRTQTADEDYQERFKSRADAEVEDQLWKSGPVVKRDYDIYVFALQTVNTGEITIHDLMVKTELRTELKVSQTARENESGRIHTFRLACGTRTMSSPGGSQYTPPETKLFPQETAAFPRGDWVIEVPHGRSLAEDHTTLAWTIYLDDSPPCTGEIDIAESFTQLTADKASAK
jgi:hypothetical protein